MARKAAVSSLQASPSRMSSPSAEVLTAIKDGEAVFEA